MKITVIPNDNRGPADKLADVELIFTDGPLQGLKLIGFSVWRARSGQPMSVTFPARTYSVNGERRSFALLRPAEGLDARNSITEAILDAFKQQSSCPEELNPVNAAPWNGRYRE